MFRTAVRLFARVARESHENVTRISRESHAGEVAQIGPAATIIKLLKDGREWKKDEMWEKCDAAGMKSKRQMKMALRWLKEKKHISVICAQNTPSEDPAVALAVKRGKKKTIQRDFLYKLHARKSGPLLPSAGSQAEPDSLG